jgi:hypothetical protein
MRLRVVTSAGCHELDPNRPGFEEARWILSEDANAEYLADVFTFVDLNSDDVWGACANFMRHIFWHKKRLVLPRPKIKGPDHLRSKPEYLLEFSRLLRLVRNCAKDK